MERKLFRTCTPLIVGDRYCILIGSSQPELESYLPKYQTKSNQPKTNFAKRNRFPCGGLVLVSTISCQTRRRKLSILNAREREEKACFKLFSNYDLARTNRYGKVKPQTCVSHMHLVNVSHMCVCVCCCSKEMGEHIFPTSNDHLRLCQTTKRQCTARCLCSAEKENQGQYPDMHKCLFVRICSCFSKTKHTHTPRRDRVI